MGKFNNYGSYIGTQNGDAGSFNNVDCIIGEQFINENGVVIDGKPKEKKQGKNWEGFEKRMREFEKRMREFEQLMRELKKRGGV